MFYAVRNGKKTGVYTSWDECKSYVIGFKRAKYKKFADKNEALAFIGLYKKTTNEKIHINDTNTISAYVDGSYNIKQNIAGYGVVIVKNNTILFKDLGAFRISEMNKSQNVFGEI